MPKDTKAILRQKTLLGETYVELTPGTQERRARSPRTAACPPAASSPTVELDEIFRAFDPKTRDGVPASGCRPARRGASTAAAQDINDALGNLAPFAEDTTTLLQILNAQQAGGAAARRATPARSSTALSERDGQLQSLITNSNKVFATTAARNQALKAHVHRAADLRARVADDARRA